MAQNFDSHLIIKVMALYSIPIYLYREATRLQCFPPTRYVRGGASRAHKRDDLYQLLTKLKFRLPGCIVWFSLLCIQLDYHMAGNFRGI